MPDVETIEVDGLDGLDQVFASIEADFQGANYNALLADELVILSESHDERFERRVNPQGLAWLPWNWRGIRDSDSHPTLEVSSTLRASLMPGGLGSIAEVARNVLTYGTNIAYAGIHNFGALIITGIALVARGGGGFLPAGSQLNIPQREFVGMNETDVDAMTERVADDAVEKLKR